jgi:hypothetical protein
MPPGGIDDAGTLSAWEKGDRGTACSPGREAEYKAGVKRAMRYAEVLACPRIHSMAGVLPAGVSREQAQTTLVTNLKWACQEVRGQGLEVLLEPINLRGIPGFFVNRQDHAHEIVAQVNEPNLKIQMDLFHCQIVEGDITTKLERYFPTGKVGHLQICTLAYLARRRLQFAQNQFQQRGFARAIGADQPDFVATQQGRAEMIDHLFVAKIHRNIGQLGHNFSAWQAGIHTGPDLTHRVTSGKSCGTKFLQTTNPRNRPRSSGLDTSAYPHFFLSQ